MVSELLPTPYGRLVWGAVAVLLAVVLGRLRLGGTAFVTIIIGFAAQRFLMEIVAGTRDEGTLSRYERRVLIR
jgi:hypothetical protein